MLWPLLLIHICGAVIGLLSGFLAMVLRKGSSWHGAAGTVFFVSMLAMSSTAVIVAGFFRPNNVNVMVGLLTFYLVLTSWWAVKHRDGKPGLFERGALLWVLFVAGFGYTFGFAAANSPDGKWHEMPPPIYFVFATVALLCAITDVRMLRRGSVTPQGRLVRHLWRMCLALLIATLSFYPGNAKFLPAEVKASPLIWAPHVFLIGSMLLWRWRMRIRKRKESGGQAIVPVANRGLEGQAGLPVRHQQG